MSAGEERRTIDKRLFQDYIESSCDRQLFLNLSIIAEHHLGDNQWRQRNEIEQKEQVFRRNRYLADMGTQYGFEVYRYLIQISQQYQDLLNYPNPITLANQSQNRIISTNLTPEYLQEMYNRYEQTEFCLLEHKYDVPTSFSNHFSQLPLSACIPDVIFARHGTDFHEPSISILDAEGNVLQMPTSELQNHYVLNIFDIKATAPQNIGKRYYADILYYMRTLNSFIYEHGLNDQYVIETTNNGLYPYFENLGFVSFNYFRRDIKIIDYDDARMLLDQVFKQIDTILNNSNFPIAREDVALEFGTHCQKCLYQADCLGSCNYDYTQTMDNRGEDQTSENPWGLDATIDLIPGVNSSMVLQLNQQGLYTIQNLADAIAAGTLYNENVPQPINAAIPTLRNKVTAILANEMRNAEPESIYATSIPRYSNNIISLAIENDPSTNTSYVFGIQFYSRMSMNSRSIILRDGYSGWWRIWHEYLRLNEQYSAAAMEWVEERLIELDNTMEHSLFDELQANDLGRFARALHFFSRNDINTSEGELSDRTMRIRFHGETYSETSDYVIETSSVIAQFANVIINLGPHRNDERQFVFNILESLGHLLRMLIIIERYFQDPIEEWMRTSSAVYYWRVADTITRFQDLLERHFTSILQDRARTRDLDLISRWISPSSRINEPSQLKKAYDLANFFEQTSGFPDPIFITWHKVARRIFDFEGINTQYWTDLFNSMDYNRWYDYLYQRQRNQQRANQHFERIQRQMYFKVNSIRRLVTERQSNPLSTALISRNPEVRTVQVNEHVDRLLPQNFTLPAKIWYQFAQLRETANSLSIVELRGTYIEFSVGKLEAAEVTDLHVHQEIQPVGRQRNPRFIYQFRMEGLSRFAKYNEGDGGILVPIQVRDSIRAHFRYESQWEITIRTKTWDPQHQNFLLETNRTPNNFFEKLAAENIEGETTWLLYPKTINVWADKLYSNTNARRPISLLIRNNIGSSWLGNRLSLIFEFANYPTISPPEINEFSLAEIYALSPDLLQNFRNPWTDEDTSTPLLTPIFPPPDAAQDAAIRYAFETPYRLIQGPPGTGKSKTIVTLCEEFILRRRELGFRETRILVTTFSYAALNVLLRNIVNSIVQDGSPSPISIIQKFYLGSSFRRIERVQGLGPQFDVNYITSVRGRSDQWEVQQPNGDTQLISGRRADVQIEELMEDESIFFAISHQIYNINRLYSGNLSFSREPLGFDLVVVDEASQYPVDMMLSSLLSIGNHRVGLVNSGFEEYGRNELMGLSLDLSEIDHLPQVVIVGDNNQLPPVMSIKPPEELSILLGSIFNFANGGFELGFRQLYYNYRSHYLIVQFVESLGLYDQFIPAPLSQNQNLLYNRNNPNLTYNVNVAENQWEEIVLNPDNIMCSMIHNVQFDSTLSIFEANLTRTIILRFFDAAGIQNEEQERHFWTNEIGIVSPHNAHGKTIINLVFEDLNDPTGQLQTHLSPQELMNKLSDTIYSVEKFQGSERSIIIASIGVSSPGQLSAEEAFLYNRNRMNVLVSRAKFKMVLIASHNFVNYVPKDQDLFFDAGIARSFVRFCMNQEEYQIQLPLPNGQVLDQETQINWRAV